MVMMSWLVFKEEARALVFGRICADMRNLRWSYRKRVTVVGLAMIFIMLSCLSVKVHLMGVVEARTEYLLGLLGTRNTSDFVKPTVDTIIVDGTDLVRLGYRYEVGRDGSSISFRPTSGNYPGENGGKSPTPFVLIVVLSEIGKEEQRRAVRDTWYRWTDTEEARVVFFLGMLPNVNEVQIKALTEEINTYSDIVVDDFVEDYYLLAVKVFRMLKWFVNSYPIDEGRPSFLVKTDHDVFNNIPNMMEHLRSVKDIKGYIGGRLHSEPPVERSGYDKWFTPYELWEEEYYPAYIGGPCYFLAGSIVPLLYETGLGERIFHLEDVFLTGMVANVKLGMRLYDVERGKMPQTTSDLGQYRHLVKRGIAQHPLTPEDMREYYEELRGS